MKKQTVVHPYNGIRGIKRSNCLFMQQHERISNVFGLKKDAKPSANDVWLQEKNESQAPTPISWMTGEG